MLYEHGGRSEYAPPSGSAQSVVHRPPHRTCPTSSAQAPPLRVLSAARRPLLCRVVHPHHGSSTVTCLGAGMVRGTVLRVRGKVADNGVQAHAAKSVHR